MSINDEILRVTGGPTVNDGLASYFGQTATESLNDAEYRWLGLQGGVGNTVADRWMSLLGPGQMNDLKLAYWSGL